MRKYVLGLCLVAAAGCMAQFALTAATHAQQQPAGSSSIGEDTLKRFLQTYVGTPRLHDETGTRYCAAFVDLTGDGVEEIIVHIMGRRWCGSGGCVTLVLAPEGSSYRVVTRITITRAPIRVLSGSSNGWRNITVWVQGGGILPGYDAELRFDGRTYPSNPSVPPARRLTRKARGKVVIRPSDQGQPLFE